MSALSLVGFSGGFYVASHIHAPQCLFSPSLLCACRSRLPHSSPAPCTMGEVYLLYLLATAASGHPKAQSKVGPLLKSLLPVCAVYPLSDSPWGGFPGRELFPWRYAFSHVATVQRVHRLGSLWKDFIQIKPASGQQKKSAAGKSVCCQD